MTTNLRRAFFLVDDMISLDSGCCVGYRTIEEEDVESQLPVLLVLVFFMAEKRLVIYLQYISP